MPDAAKSHRRALASLLLVGAALRVAPVAAEAAHRHAAEGDERLVEEIIVYGRAERRIGAAGTASEGMVGYADFHFRPLLRVGELVESMPGMVATQHSGTGKANQYFLRGFNLDHGTDFSAHLDGVPLNMRSHGHGQGYLDLNFIIPELVETAAFRKGPYHAEKGDFSSAGSIDFTYAERLPQRMVQMTLGEWGYRRGMAAGTADFGGGALTGAVAATFNAGPWQLDENLRQAKLHLGHAFDWAGAAASLSLQAYDAQWDATDQIPKRAVAAGLLDERGFIDPDLGGRTRRLALTAQAAFNAWRAGGYFVDYDFKLFSNFTYLLADPLLGDEFEQRDRRQVWGAWAQGERAARLAGWPVVYRWGGDARLDDIDEVGLHATRARLRTRTIRQDRVRELSVGVFGEVDAQLAERLRTVLGLRADHYDWRVSAIRPPDGGDGFPGLGAGLPHRPPSAADDRPLVGPGHRRAGHDRQVSPKANLAYRIDDGWEAYASWGRGFHSNDARAAAEGGRDGALLARTEGAELGLRVEASRRFNATLTGFWLELDSELVYVGDAGATEASAPSVRKGVELAAFWRIGGRLTLHAAYAASEARLKGSEDGAHRIPGAVERTFSVGANALWPNGLHVSLTARHLGGAPLVEDGSIRSQPSWLVNAGAAFHRGRLEFKAELFNVLDSGDDDIAYHYESRLAGEPDQGVADIHFHPLEPRALRATVALRF